VYYLVTLYKFKFPAELVINEEISVWGAGGMILTGGLTHSKKTCTKATLSKINPTGLALGLKSGLHGITWRLWQMNEYDSWVMVEWHSVHDWVKPK